MVNLATPAPVVPTNTAEYVAQSGLTLPANYTVEPVVEGLQGPTQMIAGPDGRLWVAQLNGQENAGTGQVVAIDLETGEQEVLLSNLRKPTGIAVLDGYLWVATQRAIQRAPLDGEQRPGALEVLLSELPFNGRSIGTLTPTPEGQLLFETSGRRSGNGATEGSGTLWQLDPANPTAPQALATGLKGAYAHAFDAQGRLWTTEIGDDPVDGGAPPDELNLVVPGADFGWPQCYGMQEPATNYGGTAERCQATRAPVVLFAQRATPTSVVASPWMSDTLLVALWLQQSVVQVHVTSDGDNATGTVEPFITGLQNPQHLLVWTDGSLLVSDFAGTIYRVRRQDG
ncbi:MAG: PQQ-dependent sugar dehydrogenase [Caldilineaceae bacterium]|nr:PQQ-dependent sugar dehydrogenase [Caldilineaceae bacterium]